MFQSSKKLMRAVLDVVDDVLVGADDLVIEPEPIPHHPHDRTVRVRIERRAGMVAPRPMHCLSPVHPAAERHRDAVRSA
jgi:hypothetical protein